MQSILMVVIVVGALGMALVASGAFALGRQKIALVILLPPLAVFAWLLLTQKFESLVIGLPLFAIVIPFDMPTGTASKIPIVLLITLALGSIWFGSMLLRKRWHTQASPLNKPILAFAIIFLLSYIWSTIWRDPVIDLSAFGRFEVVQIGSLLTYYASLLTVILVGNFVNTETRLKIFVGIFLALGSILSFVLSITNLQFPAARGLWSLWFVVPTFCIIFSVRPPVWYWRALLFIFMMLNLYVAFWINLQWKSGWVPTVIGVFIAVLIRSRRWFLVLLLTASMVAYANQQFITDMTQKEEEEGADQRIDIWEINLHLIRAHWFLGTGPAGYAVYYMTYWPNDARSTHNNYLDIIAQFGVIGMIIWFWLAITATYEGIRLYRRAPPGFLKSMAWMTTSGWIAAQASMMLGDWVLPFAYNQTITGYKYTVYSWMFLGTLVALRPLIDEQRAALQKDIAHE